MVLSRLIAEGGDAGSLLVPILENLQHVIAQDDAPCWQALREDGTLQEQWHATLLQILGQVALTRNVEARRLTLLGFLLETLETVILQRYFTSESPFSAFQQVELANRLAPEQDAEHYMSQSKRMVCRLQAVYWVLRQIAVAHYGANALQGLDYYERLFATFASHGYKLMLAQEGVEAQTLARQLAIVQESVEVIREQLLEGGQIVPQSLLEAV